MAKAITNEDSTADRVGKLLPSEVTGLYVSIRAIFIDTQASETQAFVLIGVALVVLVISIFYIYTVRDVNNKTHIFIYSMTFAIWALTLDGDRFDTLIHVDFFRDYFSKFATAISIIWSFIIPVLIPNKAVASTSPAPATGAPTLDRLSPGQP